MENIDPILNSYLDERNSSLLYQTLSEVEKNPRLAEVYKRISATEATHAETWKAKAAEKGLQVPEFRATWRVRTLIWLARRFGPSMILPTIQGMEQQGTSGYANMAGAKVSSRVAPWRRSKDGIARGAEMPCAPQCWVPTMGWYQTSAW